MWENKRKINPDEPSGQSGANVKLTNPSDPPMRWSGDPLPSCTVSQKTVNMQISSHPVTEEVERFAKFGKEFLPICDIAGLGFSPDLKQCEAQALFSVVSQHFPENVMHVSLSLCQKRLAC